MNIKEFLIDNYIWIIVVIVLAIITIIGFLADKKKDDNKKGKVQTPPQPQNIASAPLQQPFNYQPPMPQMAPQPEQMAQSVAPSSIPTMNATPVNFQSVPNTQVMSVNNAVNSEQNTLNVGNTQSVVPPLPIPTPVEPVVIQKTEPEPQPVIYQPLSEQKPAFAPQPIPMNIPNVQPVIPVSEQPPVSPQPMPMNYPEQNLQMNNGTIPQPIPQPHPTIVPTPINPPQGTNPQPVNFVYGENNNQNM